MTIIVEPITNSTADPSMAAAANRYGAGDMISRNGESVYAQHDSRVDAPLNAAAYLGDNDVSGGIEVQIGTFEAMIGGHLVISDDDTIDEHTVVLEADTPDQEVYLGVDRSQPNSIIIGLESEFTSPADPAIPIWHFDTNATSVTSATSMRPLGPENTQSDQFYSRTEADLIFLTANEADNLYLNVSGDSLDDDLDFGGNQTLNRAIEGRSSVPSNPSERQEWIRTDTNIPRYETYVDGKYWGMYFDPIRPVVADFEGGDLSEFSVTDTDHVVTQTASIEGQYGLDLGGQGTTTSMTGLPNYPEAGDSFEMLFRPTSFGSSPLWRFEFAVQSTDRNNLYRLNFDSSGVGLFARENENNSSLLTVLHSWSAGERYRIKVDWSTNGVFTVTAYNYSNGTELGSDDNADLANTSFSSGGIAFWTNSFVTLDVDEWVLLPDGA